MSFIESPSPEQRPVRLRAAVRAWAGVAALAISLVGPSLVGTSDSSAGQGDVRAGDAPVRRVQAETTSRNDGPAYPDPIASERLDVFRGLGAWIDLFDVDLDARAYVARMARSGVRTLYIQTGRSNSAMRVDPRVGPWLVAAHDAGMQVVGWYLPFYAQPKLDRVRTLAIESYRYRGHRFDGLGIDIEYRAAVRGPFTWNLRVVKHLAAVREALGPGYPIAAIPPTPLQMQVAPGHWAGFPWRGLGEHADAILLMSYWSDRLGCPHVRRHCAYEFTARNVALTRSLIGRSDRIIHVIGGVGDSIDGADVRDFVRGAIDSAANGASIYDARTTRAQWWKDLSALQRLG